MLNPNSKYMLAWLQNKKMLYLYGKIHTQISDCENNPMEPSLFTIILKIIGIEN